MSEQISLRELRENAVAMAGQITTVGAEDLFALVEAVEAAQTIGSIERHYRGHEENSNRFCSVCSKWIDAMERLTVALARFDFGDAT